MQSSSHGSLIVFGCGLVINAVILCGCVSKLLVEESPKIPPPELTIENLLQIPLQRSTDGYGQLVSRLKQTYPLVQISADGSVMGSKQTLQLQDGFRLKAVYIYQIANEISVSMDTEPCFSASYAIRLIDADPPRMTVHETYDYKQYSKVTGDFEVIITVPGPRFECVDHISVVRVSSLEK